MKMFYIFIQMNLEEDVKKQTAGFKKRPNNSCIKGV